MHTSLCADISDPLLPLRARRSSLNEDELDSGSLLVGKPLVKKKSLSLDLRHPDMLAEIS